MCKLQSITPCLQIDLMKVDNIVTVSQSAAVSLNHSEETNYL